MKTAMAPAKPRQTGAALMLTMVMTGIALAILAGAMTWSMNSTRLTYRSIQYTRSIAAAEAATEKVLSRVNQDFLSGGEKLVGDNLASYRLTVPGSSDSSYWNQWEFNDASGHTGQTYVQSPISSTYVIMTSPYTGLRAFASFWTVVAHARDTASSQQVVGGVFQQTQLTRIPIYQFALFSSGDMETCCAEPYTQKGRVHANGTLYAGPDSVLTFQGDVTSATKIVLDRDPLDPRGAPAGSVVFQAGRTAPIPSMNLPIGTNSTPQAIREIIQPPPGGEDPNSPMGRLRFYNLADMVMIVSDTGIAATSGRFDNFATAIPTNQLAKIVTTTNSFTDAREGKTIKPIDIDVGALNAWSATNTSLRVALGSKDVSSIYVLDTRTLPGTSLAAVRVRNGTTLPSLGLTVATARPLYVLGNFNQTNSTNLGTTNTITTRPASLVADAVTVLSVNWTDANSTKSLGSRIAGDTTINAAILTGAVDTTTAAFSGGMENFMRLLEDWPVTLTYNGSLVKMFSSLYATNVWGKSGVYSPPIRHFAYDLNFADMTKIPPLTPSLQTVVRGQWATVAPDKNVVAAAP
jgi:hypothetical protein